jgi:hypothetical protein
MDDGDGVVRKPRIGGVPAQSWNRFLTLGCIRGWKYESKVGREGKGETRRA